MSHDEGYNFLDLEAESEWRFELDADENIAVRVQSHDPVYINSEELPTSTWYPLLRNLKSAVYAPSGAQLEVTQLPASQYASSSTTQPALLSLHLALERLRILARRTLSATNGSHEDSYEQIHRGPRVMVLGPPSSGKTSIVKGLVNLATGSGMGWTPAVVGLDPSSPSNLIPGSLSLSLPSNPLSTQHAAHSLGSPPTSVAANTLGADVPTVGWWYGHLEPTNKGSDIWKRLVESIGEKLRDKVAKDQIALASGILVDTSSAFTTATLGTRKENPKARYSLLAHAIEALEIETLVVIGHEKLSIDLTRQFPSVRTIRFPKSGGTVDLDDAYRQVVQAAQVRAYFYGEPSLPKELSNLPGKMVAREGILSPYSFQIGWETLTILRVGEENAAPSTALPLGSSRILSPTRLTKVDPSGPAHITRLLNTVLAVVHLTPGDRIVKEKKVDVKEEKVDVKSEDAVKVEQGEEQDPTAEEDDDDEEVPYREEIGWREAAGFIVITAIDSQKKKYTVLSPSPGFLPSKVAIAGQIEWVDSE